MIAVLAFAIRLYLSMRLASATVPVRPLDPPDARSLHQQPVSKTGRLVVRAAIKVGAVLMAVETASPATPDFGVRSRRSGRAS